MIGELWIANFLVTDAEKDKKGYFYVQIEFGLWSRENRTGKISPVHLFNAFIGHWIIWLSPLKMSSRIILALQYLWISENRWFSWDLSPKYSFCIYRVSHMHQTDSLIETLYLSLVGFLFICLCLVSGFWVYFCGCGLFFFLFVCSVSILFFLFIIIFLVQWWNKHHQITKKNIVESSSWICHIFHK